MTYTLNWKNPGLPGKGPINVAVASTVSTAASLTFTGKGAANYGQIQQTNLLRLLENSADAVAPLYPTIGQLWFDSTNGVLSVCTSVSPETWETLAGIQVTSGIEPSAPSLGDLWFDKTGAYTGVLYVYTGTGRYPLVSWDPVAAGAFSQPSPLVAPYSGIKANFADFTTPNTNEAYIHGFTGSVAADVDGQIAVDEALTLMPRGSLFTELPNSGFIVWDTTSTLLTIGGGPNHFFQVREVELGAWEYDNNTAWVPFTPATGMHVIGTIVVAEPDDNTPPGISSAIIWSSALDLSTFIPAALSGTVAPGGWQQIWPGTEYFGARFEYDALLQKVLALVGSPYTYGGNGALSELPMPDLRTMDASLVGLHFNAPVPDINFARPEADAFTIKMETNSQDWDLLLAAARWAVSRLDMTADMYTDISEFPFTQDGLPAPMVLSMLPSNDVRHPTAARHSSRRWGSVTATRLYAETVNVLTAAVATRYTMRGMLGGNSTVPTFSNTTTTSLHCTHRTEVAPTGSGVPSWTGGSPTYLFLNLNFIDDDDLRRFVHGGSAVQIAISYSAAAPNAVDSAFSAFLSTYGKFRVVADRTYTLTAADMLAADPSVSTGFLAAATIPSYTTATSSASGGHSVMVHLARTALSPLAPDTYSIRLSLSAPAGLTGIVAVDHSIIRDSQTHDAGVPFFPPPLAYVAGVDDSASSLSWLGAAVVVPLAPTANFTLTPNPATGNPATVTLLDTSTGSPTSIDWDFTNDGIFDVLSAPAGSSTGPSYTPGVYSVRMRASNAGGTSIAVKTLMVNTPVAAPTITLNPGSITANAGVANANFVVGTYTGTISSVVVNSGPGSFVNYNFSGGTVYYQGPLYVYNSGSTISLTVSNAGGSATGTSGTLSVTPIGFSVTTTSWTLPSGSSINSFAPRKTIAACVTFDNVITGGSLATGTIPPGTSVQFNQGGNGDVIILGTPTTPGVYTFTLLVQDGYVAGSPATTTTSPIVITIT